MMIACSKEEEPTPKQEIKYDQEIEWEVILDPAIPYMKVIVQGLPLGWGEEWKSVREEVAFSQKTRGKITVAKGYDVTVTIDQPNYKDSYYKYKYRLILRYGGKIVADKTGTYTGGVRGIECSCESGCDDGIGDCAARYVIEK
jgi:hypothetical protein